MKKISKEDILDYFNKEKPDIDYPCNWQYKIIGIGADEMEKAILKIIPDRNVSIQRSKISRKGKYLSLNISTTIFSDEDNQRIQKALEEDPNIIYVV